MNPASSVAASRGPATQAPDPHASEEMRDLIQQRLALFGLLTLCLSGVFLLIAVIVDVVLDGPAIAFATLLEPRRYLNFVGTLVSAAVWLLSRAGRRSPRQLMWIDGLGTVSAAVPYTLMSVLDRSDLTGVLLVALTLMLVLQTRALLIPSDLQRTLAISTTTVLLAFFLALGAQLGGWSAQVHETDVAHVSVNLLSWLTVIVAVSGVASWVLFGLRAAVAEARKLGQYTLVEKIGEGGMGTVYRASHALLRRPTAIKLLSARGTQVTDAERQRFEREVQLTASLVHPNTVTVFDYGTTPDGIFYYAMEYLDGGDLESVVGASGPMPPARVAHLLTQVAAGLSEAHEIGLIHRDIKPANILLASKGPVADLAKLVDFGLVRDTASDGPVGLTQTNTVMGTPLYMAPEAITAPETVDARADLYALGAVGYYLLTGTHVFDGRTVVEICSHHLHTQPETPSERLGEAIPEMLEELVMRCLEKDPAARPQSADMLRELLEACDDVGRWSNAEARRWWAEHGDRIRSRDTEVSPIGTAPTLAVDLAAR